jgi:hypothetical protein
MFLAITAFILLVIFSTLDFFFSIKPNGKLAPGVLIRLTFFMLVIVTGITDIISKGVVDQVDKEKILKTIDSSALEIDKRIDSLKNVKPDSLRPKLALPDKSRKRLSQQH